MAETGWGEKLRLIPWILLETLERLFTENKLLKLTSLSIAFLMWLFLSIQEQTDRTLQNIPLHVDNHRKDTIVTTIPLRVVDLRVRGRLATISDLGPQDMFVQVEADGLDPGNHTLLLSPDQVVTQADVEILRIDPSSIPIMVESRLTRKVAVIPQLNMNSLPPEMGVAQLSVTPEMVTVTGPESKVGKLTAVDTPVIDLDAEGSKETYPIQLVSGDPNTTISPSRVSVAVKLDHLVEKQFYDLRPDIPRKVLPRSVKPVTVTLRGPRSLVDDIDRESLTVKLGVDTLPPGEHEVSLSLELAEQFRRWVEVVSIAPETMVIRIR